MPVIFQPGPLGSSVTSPQVQRQAYLSGLYLGRGVQHRQGQRRFADAFERIQGAKETADEMAANPEGPWAEGYDPLESGLQDVLNMAKEGGIDSDDLLALTAYADQIRQEQREEQGRAALQGRLTELAGVSPLLQPSMQALAMAAQDPSVPTADLLRGMTGALRDHAQYEFEKGQRTAEWMAAQQALMAANTPEFQQMIPRTRPVYDELGQPAGEEPNPLYQEFVAQQYDRMSRAGMQGITFLNSRAGEALARAEMGMQQPLGPLDAGSPYQESPFPQQAPAGGGGGAGGAPAPAPDGGDQRQAALAQLAAQGNEYAQAVFQDEQETAFKESVRKLGGEVRPFTALKRNEKKVLADRLADSVATPTGGSPEEQLAALTQIARALSEEFRVGSVSPDGTIQPDPEIVKLVQFAAVSGADAETIRKALKVKPQTEAEAARVPSGKEMRGAGELGLEGRRPPRGEGDLAESARGFMRGER